MRLLVSLDGAASAVAHLGRVERALRGRAWRCWTTAGRMRAGACWSGGNHLHPHYRARTSRQAFELRGVRALRDDGDRPDGPRVHRGRLAAHPGRGDDRGDRSALTEPPAAAGGDGRGAHHVAPQHRDPDDPLPRGRPCDRHRHEHILLVRPRAARSSARSRVGRRTSCGRRRAALMSPGAGD